MITVYARQSGGIVSKAVPANSPLPEGVVWIDLLTPDESELRFIGQEISATLPSREEMGEIEQSSRLYSEDNCLFLTVLVIYNGGKELENQDDVSFILSPTKLITVRYVEEKSISLFSQRITKQSEQILTPEDMLLGLLDALSDRTADLIELQASHMDKLAQSVFATGQDTSSDHLAAAIIHGSSTGADLQDVLKGIGRAGNLLHKIRETLSGMERLLAYLSVTAVQRLNRDQKINLKSIQRDIRSLTEHVTFLSHEASFLLEATLGMVNLEQNKIIKVISVVSVAFLPPTLVGTIYGMNFKNIPELDWHFGYPLAIIMMLLSGILPLIYFRMRQWL